MATQPSIGPDMDEATMNAAPSPPGQGEMTLLEHLKELRNRLLITAIFVVVGVAVCLYFWETILGWMLAPAREQDPTFQVSSFSPIDRIGIWFKIGMYGGLAMASPVIIYETMAFVLPGLTPKERRLLLPGMLGVVVCLLGGMAFAYWIILPASLGFLLDLGSDQIQNVIGIKAYVDFVVRIVFWVGVAFELPVVLALLGKLNVVRAGQMLRFWRYALVLIFIIAAVVTPTPDALTMSLVVAPLLGLYGIGMLLAWLLQPRRPASTTA